MKLATTLAAAALLLLGACSGDPEVLEPDPTASTDATVELPRQALESSDEGAAAHAYHWIELFNQASISGDTAALEAFSEGCDACLDYAKTIADLPAGDRPDSPPWEVTATVVNRDDVASDVRFTIRILGDATEDLAFELTPRAPYEIADVYSVVDE